ncbi:MAG: Gfo/Idh/MocA family protein [Spirochaetota bacterium]
MDAPIRIGLIGLGRAGMHGHLPELAARPDQFVVTTGYDPIPERRAELRQRTGAEPRESEQEVINDPGVDLVDVANRSVDHHATARSALEAGKYVLVEKPLCVTYEEARELVELDAKLGGGRLFVRHNRRFDPDFVHFKEIIASGILGTVFEIKLRRHKFDRRNDWQTVRAYGGGQLLNWGAHVVDHGLQLLGGPLASVWSDVKRVAAAGDAEDHVRIMLRSEPISGPGAASGDESEGTAEKTGPLGGRVVDIEISGGVAIAEPVYTAYGTRGTLVGSTTEFELRYLDPAVRLPRRDVDLAPPVGYDSDERLSWEHETRAVAPVDTQTMWDGLYAAIRTGGTYPVTLEQALEVMRVVSEARRGTLTT